MGRSCYWFLIATALLMVCDAGLSRRGGCPANAGAYRSRAQVCQSPFSTLRQNPSMRLVCRKFKEAEPCMKRLHSECSSLRAFVGTHEYQMRQELRKIC